MAKRKTLLVVDGMNYMHRGYWAVGAGLKNKDGNPTAAIKGFMNILMADLAFLDATHCAVVFDRPGGNFRYDLYPEYKATREESDDSKALRKQVRPTKEILNSLGIKVFGIRGEEGDDLIGSLAVSAHEDDPTANIYIGSNDKDFASLVNKRIKLLRPQKEIITAKGVVEKWGVKPSQMVEYLMLLGDGVDNIPGVNKVGPVTAAKILNTHGSIKAWLPTKKTPAMQKNVDAVKKFFPLSNKLITIKTDCFPNMTLDKLRIGEFDEDRLEAICSDLDFKTTHKQLRTLRYRLG